MDPQSLDQPTQNASEPQALVSDDYVAPPKSTFVSWLLRYRIVLLVVLMVIAGGLVLISRNTQPIATTQAGDFDVIQANLKTIAPNLSEASSQFLTINGELQVASSIIISPSIQPQSGVVGQLYFDQETNQLNYFNGEQFLPVGGNTTFIQNSTSILNGGDTITNNITNATAGITTTGGTTNALLKFTSAQTVGDSIASDSGTFLSLTGGINIFAGSTLAEKTLFTPSTTPVTIDGSDTTPALELGVKFQVDVPGVVKAIRFYKTPTQSGTFTGSLWTSGGTLLGQAVFSVSASGWQQVNFPSPIPISTDTTYVASYHHAPTVPGSPLGYPYEAGRFGAGSIDNPPLHGLASGLDGGNGVFKPTASPAMPNLSFNSTNYFVDLVFEGSVATTDSRIRFNNTQISSSDLANDSNLAKRASSQVFSGHNIFRNGSDSADAFAVQKADTTPLFTVDTQSSLIYIGPGSGSNTATLLILSRQTAFDDPPGTNGAIYYNSILENFRCYQEGQWNECGEVTANHGYSLYEEFLGGQTNSFGTNNIIGSLGWNAQAIGANGNIDFNPVTPTPIANRPGVLALQTPAVANQGTTLMLANSNGASMIISKGNSLKTAVAVGATSGLVLRVGLHNETSTTTQPVSGVWWEADPATNANWRYCYGNGTTANCTNTNNPITADTWARLEIRVTGIGTGSSSASFYINGSNVANLTAITIDTTGRVSPAYTCYGTSGSAQNCYWDYFQLRGTTTVAR